MEKVSFLEKCLAKLNLSEDGKVGLAVDAIIKSYNKEIKAYERKISDLTAQEADRLLDMQEVLAELIAEKNEVVATIDVTNIQSNEARKSYVSIYTRKVRNAISKVKNQEEAIAEYKESVADTIKEYQEQIDMFKELLTEMD